MNKKNKVLLSFIGSNDAGKLNDKTDGAILTALKNEKFDHIHLLWNKGTIKEITYEKIAEYLKTEIIKRKLAKKVFAYEFPIKDVTNHNIIYTSLIDFTETLNKSEEFNYTAAISSGTPAMQVCWILLAESGDFSELNSLRLIQVKDPKFGKSENLLVKIDTSLPRILRLKEEVKTLKKDLIPSAIITITKPGLKIDETDIK
jgi:sigma54-dependent transcription regulator